MNHRASRAKHHAGGSPLEQGLSFLPRATYTEILSEPFSGFAYEEQELIFWHLNDSDSLALRFSLQMLRRLMLGNKEGPWPLILVCLALRQHLLGLHSCQFSRA